MIIAGGCVSIVVYWFWRSMVYGPVDEMILFFLMISPFIIPIVYSFNTVKKPNELLLFEGGRIG